MDSLRLTRYHTVQVGLILATGFTVAVASCVFPALASFLLLLIGLATYSLFTLFLYRKEGRTWRERLTDWLSNFLLARLTAQLASPVSRRTSGPRFLFTNRGKVALLPHREAQKLIQFILRDFVMSWFRKVSSDGEMPRSAARLLEHIAVELNLRIQDVDIDKLIKILLPFIDPYLMAINDAGCVTGRGQAQFDVNHPYCLMLFEKKTSVCHPALLKEGGEIEHARRLVDMFILCAVPGEFSSCDPASMFIREVLVTKLVLPLISRLCDPDFLLRAIPMILKKASPETVAAAFEQIRKENIELEKDLAQPNGLLSSILDMPSSSAYFSKDEQVDADTQEDVPTSIETYSKMQRSSVVYRRPLPGSSRARASSLPHHPPPLTVHHHTIREGSTSSSLEEEELEELEMVGLPSIYITRHVRLELKDGIHTGYIIKFPRGMLSDQDLFGVRPGPMEDSDHELEALKRYSDFDILHRNLLRSFGKHVKGMVLPNRRPFDHFIKMLPFTSDEPDLATILERRDGLERYIQAISAIEEIQSSAIFHDFLADGVKMLREANVVHSQSIQVQRPNKRFSFIPDWMRTSTEQQQPQTKQLITETLPMYIEDSLLPLTCTTLHTIKDAPPTTTPPQASQKSPNKLLPSNAQNLRSASPLPNMPLPRNTPPPSPMKPSAAPTPKNSPKKSYSTSTLPIEAISTSLPVQKLSNTVQADTDPQKVSQSLKTSSSSPLVVANCDSEKSEQTDCSADDSFAAAGLSHQNDREEQCDHSHSQNRETSFWDKAAGLFWKMKAVAVEKAISLYRLILSAVTVPVTHKDLEQLAKEREELSPLANSLLSLANEATRSTSPELWLTSESSQLALLGVVGGVIDWYIWKELHEVVYDDERWTRALFNLRQVLWPDGKLDVATRPPVSKEERAKLRDQAVIEIKKFLPNLLPYIVGSSEYDSAIHHCLDCIQNPRINRHFIYGLLDVVIPELVPEISEKEFQQKIKAMRTLPPFVKKTSL